MQEGYSDCGLFAIAFMTALANGKQPGGGGFFFEQRARRDHLMQCLQEQNMMTFQKTRHTAMKFKSVTNLCKCRMQTLPRFTTIQCSNCKA